MNLNKEFKIEMLPNSYKYIAELIGLEQAMVIAKHLGGNTIYIPKVDLFSRYNRNMKIVDDYKLGLTYSQIAIKYNLTGVSVRNIISSCL